MFYLIWCDLINTFALWKWANQSTMRKLCICSEFYHFRYCLFQKIFIFVVEFPNNSNNPFEAYMCEGGPFEDV